MKKVTLIGIIAFMIMFIVGVVVATQFGEKSPIYFHAKLSLDDKLTKRASGHRVLFITLFDENSPRPMPYGATRFVLPKAPEGNFINLSITHENLQLMSQGQDHPQKFRVKARLDGDGQAGKDQAGDIVGIKENVEYGSTNIEILLNEVK